MDVIGRRAWYLASIILLFALFAQLLTSAPLKSPTMDEPNHLTRGYAYLKTGKLRFTSTTGHPPLFNLVSALPLSLLQDIGSPQDYAGWEGGFINAYAIDFVFNNPVSLEHLFFLGRLPTLFVTLCLAALIARWSSELYGPWGGVLSLFLCAFDPNLIAHGRLVTTDLGIAFFFVLVTYIFWRFLRKPSFSLLILTGMTLGAAQCVKFSAILLLPIIGMIGLVEAFNPKDKTHFLSRLRVSERRWISALLALGGALVLITLLAGLTIWAVYRFEVRPPVGWPVAVPAPVHVEGLQAALSRVSADSPTFLMGQHLNEGRWYYFPIAFVVKTPLPSLVALLLAIVSSAKRWFSRDEWPLGVAVIAYTAASLRSSLNLGYRHLLPVLPFLWVYAGRLTLVWPRRSEGGTWKRRIRTLACSLLGAWLVIGTLGIWPDYLAYFNELAGGPDGGWRWLGDSNLDWGQDLYSLRAHLEEYDDAPVHVSWFGSTYPHRYDADLSYRHLPGRFSHPYPHQAARSPYNPFHPAPGLYAISVTNLQGTWLTDADMFERFRSRRPLDRVGHSIFIYEVAASPQQTNPNCVSGLAPKDLNVETIAHSLGRGPGWVKWFDHKTSFILPGGGDVSYVLPSPPLGFVPDWQEAFRDCAEVTCTQDEADHQRAATVYTLERVSTKTLREDVLTSLSLRPLAWSPASHYDAGTPLYPLDAPVVFDHGLEFLGYRLLSDPELSPGQTLELVTVWRVTGEMPPATADLRTFVHLLDASGQMLTGEDRLDLEPLTWEPGDVLIQQHRPKIPPHTGPGTYQLEVGLYTPDTMQRLAAHTGDGQLAERLLLQPVRVQTR